MKNWIFVFFFRQFAPGAILNEKELESMSIANTNAELRNQGAKRMRTQSTRFRDILKLHTKDFTKGGAGAILPIKTIRRL